VAVSADERIVVPRPARTPEWVGEGDLRQDVSSMTDRALLIKAIDEALHLRQELGRMVYTLDQLGHRVAVLESARPAPLVASLVPLAESGPTERPPLPPPLPIEVRDREHSSHEWDALFVQAGQVLSERVKDPRDRLDSKRARAIAKEVVEGVKEADDAKAFRTWKSRSLAIGFEVLKFVAAAAAGALAARYGLRV
jgi:hypothetical protein